MIRPNLLVSTSATTSRELLLHKFNNSLASLTAFGLNFCIFSQFSKLHSLALQIQSFLLLTAYLKPAVHLLFEQYKSFL